MSHRQRQDEINGETLASQPDRSVHLSPVAIHLLVKSVGDDHLVCRSWNGVDEGTVDIYVAKPQELRKTPYHGKTITIDGSTLTFNYTSGSTRTVTKGGSTANQMIKPSYTGVGTGYSGEAIWAIRVWTGVKVNVGTPTAERMLTLLDLNVGGRQWAKV